MPDFTEFKVGEPYPGLSFPVPEMGEFLVYDAGPELRLFYHQPSAKEVQAARNGVASFGLAYQEDLIWFLYRFGDGIPWSDAPFTQWLVPEERRASPRALEREQRYLMQVSLADADTGIIKALRQLTLTPEMSWTLRDMYTCQAQTEPIDQAEYQRRSRLVQARYPSSEALLRKCEAKQ